VIGDRPLESWSPLRDPKTGMRVTPVQHEVGRAGGLVKFDFLGLKTLTVLRIAVELIRRRGVEIDLAALPLDDPKTYEPLCRGETVGVFQVESGGMRKALVDMSADRFEDLIALVALYRPGPMANIPVYCARKLGKGEPETEWYPHPKLASILKETFGIIVYQEQVMEVAKLLAGYSLGDADLLRRAMGKKIKAEMDAQRERFVSGAVERGLTKALADEIFDLLAKFADYGFNKSHAAAYALVAYQTAYLKANYPVEFLAASMTHELDNTDKLAEFRREAQRLGIRSSRPRSIVRASSSTCARAPSTTRWRRSRAWAPGCRGDRRGPGSRSVPRPRRSRTALNAKARQQADAREPDRRRVRWTRSIATGRGRRPRSGPMIGLAQQASEGSSAGMDDMFGGVAATGVTLRIPPMTRGRKRRGCARNMRRPGSSCPGTRSTSTATCSTSCGREVGGFLPSVKGGARWGGLRRPCSIGRSGAPRPGTSSAS
jgi:DNA polymerase-3 subunit alpha